MKYKWNEVLIYPEETHKLNIIPDNLKNVWACFCNWGQGFGGWWEEETIWCYEQTVHRRQQATPWTQKPDTKPELGSVKSNLVGSNQCTGCTKTRWRPPVSCDHTRLSVWYKAAWGQIMQHCTRNKEAMLHWFGSCQIRLNFTCYWN